MKLLEGTDRLAEQHEDHYDNPAGLSLCQCGKGEVGHPQMDDVIKRTGTVISRHTIYDKNGNEKPNSEHWIDDNWLLWQGAVLQARVLRRDGGVQLRRGYLQKGNDPSPGFAVDRQDVPGTLRSSTKRKTNSTTSATKVIFPKKNRWELEATFADYYVQVRNNSKAIEHLTRAPELAPRRPHPLPVHPLGQLQQAAEKFSWRSTRIRALSR